MSLWEEAAAACLVWGLMISLKLVYHSLSTSVTGLYYNGSISLYENLPRHQTHCFPSGSQKKLSTKFDTQPWVYSFIIHKELQISPARYWRIIHSNNTTKKRIQPAAFLTLALFFRLYPLCVYLQGFTAWKASWHSLPKWYNRIIKKNNNPFSFRVDVY